MLNQTCIAMFQWEARASHTWVPKLELGDQRKRAGTGTCPYDDCDVLTIFDVGNSDRVEVNVFSIPPVTSPQEFVGSFLSSLVSGARFPCRDDGSGAIRCSRYKPLPLFRQGLAETSRQGRQQKLVPTLSAKL